jgi:hypothetical protein
LITGIVFDFLGGYALAEGGQYRAPA